MRSRVVYSLLLLVCLLGSMTLVDSAPLRGSRHVVLAETADDWHISRRAMEDKNKDQGDDDDDDDDDDDETETPTSTPSEKPSVTPSEVPSLLPSSTPSTSTGTGSLAPSISTSTSPATATVPTQTPTSTSMSLPPTSTGTASLPPNQRQLSPFSVTIRGDLADESILRLTLQTYLVETLQQDIPSLLSVTLTPAPTPALVSVPATRRLQDNSTQLDYESVATLNMQDVFDQGPPPTEASLQRAQITALESGLLPQVTVAATSLWIQQVQVGDQNPVFFLAPSLPNGAVDVDSSSSNKDDDDKGNVGILVGVGVAVVVALALLSQLVWRRTTPYDKEDDDDDVDDDDDSTFTKPPPPPPPYNFQSGFVHPDAELSLEEESSNNTKSRRITTIKTSTSKPKKQRSVPNIAADVDVVAPTVSIQPDSSGMEVVDISAPVIDLTKPPTHAHGIVVSSEGNDNDDDDDDSMFAYLDGIQPAGSYDESMAGYSLATEPAEEPRATTTPANRIIAPPRVGTQSQPDSFQIPPNQQRWIGTNTNHIQQQQQQPLPTLQQQEQEQNSTTNSNPAEVLRVESKDDDQSSYQEGDSGQSSSLLSGISDAGSSYEGVYGGDGVAIVLPTSSALGQLHQEDEEEFLGEDYKTFMAAHYRKDYDNGSDVPSDEQEEDGQDLTGFSSPEARAIEHGLNKMDQLATTPPRTNTGRGRSTNPR